ncbi:hypothetical protein A8C56_08410 [Niabella ginsenosidivorans]|uniref:Uncharacterized protein n=1 Tax=Niabella ginsenosidivorans TaxID=1176587 RepID=A0A1A9I028_9BACT|nr:hypothetical protein A8C56_08410 [Niabella ginsenosidivorans]
MKMFLRKFDIEQVVLFLNIQFFGKNIRLNLISYSYIEQKTAYLLYFVLKNHSCSVRYKLLYKENGTRGLADNALVALTLMIAESKPEEMNMMIKVVVNLINRNN